jgi:hypothetical protein
MVRAAGMTWHEVFGIAAPPQRQSNLAADVIRECLQRPDLVTEWEYSFLISLRGFCRLSHKQRQVLSRIADKVRRETYHAA